MPWGRSFRARPRAAERHPAGGTAAPLAWHIGAVRRKALPRVLHSHESESGSELAGATPSATKQLPRRTVLSLLARSDSELTVRDAARMRPSGGAIRHERTARRYLLRCGLM